MSLIISWLVRLAAGTVLATALHPGPVSAQSYGGYYSPPIPEPTQLEDYVTADVATTLQPHEADLLGDDISPDTGALSFRHVDVSIPGNSSLPVAFGRYIDANAERHVNFGPNMPVTRNGVGWNQSWSMMIPHIMTRTPHDGVWNATRCSAPIDEPEIVESQHPGLSVPDSWAGRYGIRLYSPDGGLRPLLTGIGSQYSADPPDLVTKDYWRVDCRSGSNGEFFEVTAPNGHIYTLDKFYTYKPGQLYVPRFPALIDTTSGGFDPSENHIAYPTEIRDQFGNWVRYEYDDTVQGVTRIHSNDGREIRIFYANGSVSRVEAHGRTWTYSYTNGVLDRVTLPDGRYWTIGALDGVGYANAPFIGQTCWFGSDAYMRHPDGVEGFFSTTTIVNFQGDHPFPYRQPSSQRAQCMASPTPSDYTPQQAHDEWRNFLSSAVTEKRLVIPGAADAVWTYEYEDGDHFHLDPYAADVGDDPTDLTSTRKRRTVTNPDGSVTKLEFDIRFDTEGSLLSREIYGSAGAQSPVQSEVFEYTLGPVVGGLTHYTYGMSFTAHMTPNQRTRFILTRDGETYTTDMAYNSFHQLNSSASSSTLGGGARTVAIDYLNDIGQWILGLPTRITHNGVVSEEVGYNADRLPITIDRFGARFETRSYNASGALVWVRDGLSRQISFSNWRRGRPQTVTRPDASVLSRTVNDFGQLSSKTDARGTTTHYTYSPGGWLTGIDRPSGFADTALSYSGLGLGLVQTIDHGALRTIVSHDAMLRPTLEERRPLSSGGGTIFTRYEYDALGRTVFQSFPSASLNPSAGVDTTYDALGRVIRTEETVSPFAATVTAYLSDNRVRVTDALANVATTWRSGWSSPADGQTIRIDHPLGLTTQMTHDAWGNLLTARQYGSHSGFSVDETQVWAYDSRLRLCRHATAQSGHTLYAYDSANQVTGVARGAAAGSGCASLPASQRVTTSYDLLGRVATVDYPDASPDIAFSYDANGNLTAANRGTTSWAYAYDALDRLTNEVLSVDGRLFAGAMSYTADGRLATRTTPAGRTIQFSPNGHGRPTGVHIGSASYASNGAYHPSGHLAAVWYGNGLLHVSNINARQQVVSSRLSAGSVSRLHAAYGRDALGRVTSVTDYVTPGETRSFGYDALGRLTTASGPWGAGSYSYDLLNNIRSKTLGLRAVDLDYDASGRLDRYRDTGAGGNWNHQTYDPRSSRGQAPAATSSATG